MDTKTYFSLAEAYTAVYDEELREDYLEEDYSFIDDLYEEELEEVVEEVIYDLLDEGYDFEEVESLFEDTFLTEAVVTSDSDRKTGRGKVTTGTGSLKAAQARVAKRKQEKRAERKEKIKSAAKGVLSNIRKGIKRAAKKTMVGAEKAKQALSGVDRGAERAKRQQRARMVQTARKGIKKAVTGKANTTYRGAGVGRKETASSGSYTPPKKETPQGTKRSTIGNVSGPASSPKKPVAKVTRKDVTGSTGAGAAGTIRSKSSSGSGDGPSSKGRSLPPKGATSRTPAGNPRKPSQVTLALSRAATTGRKNLVNASFDIFDIVNDFLISEGLAENVSEANWIMVNQLDSEDIDAILEVYEIDEATTQKK